MARIQALDEQTADAAAADLLASLGRQMGKVPKLIATMANSPAVANAYLAFNKALSRGALPARLREQIALVVAESNSCEYCLAAHTTLGKAAGLSEQETCDARSAVSGNAREQVALMFARRLVKERGLVDDVDFEQLRQAEYTDGEIAEIVANVSLNIFTNYFNHVAQTEVDFPAAPSVCAS